MADGETIRLDRFLWFARLAKTRTDAQAIAEKGTLRLDGRRIERSAAAVRIGSIIVFPLHGKVRALRVEALPKRRGPPAEAAQLYTALEIHVPKPVDDGDSGA
ncbi:MAG: RNA-binding S4 domain-containing protein [Sphingomonas sp.]|uniref:RNA-binding S4 domain-containing protein n=1 Tax=Sphingomonas sp. TaxID=28214 RepID=UPI001B1A3348|nr:S4 domain-containing protein [Sphingomonas sp.]MBO9621745.1 RNA-binding S4 domain-containing protein [Sphingomonas sp.]